MSAVGENIRKHRIKRGLSIEGLARQTLLSTNYLGALERGDERYKNPKIDSLRIIAKALEISLADVFGDELGEKRAPLPSMPGTPVIPEGYFKLDENAQAFFKLWQAMSEANHKAMFIMAEQLTGNSRRPSKSLSGAPRPTK